MHRLFVLTDTISSEIKTILKSGLPMISRTLPWPLCLIIFNVALLGSFTKTLVENPINYEDWLYVPFSVYVTISLHLIAYSFISFCKVLGNPRCSIFLLVTSKLLSYIENIETRHETKEMSNY